MREKYICEWLSSQIEYEENKLLSFHRSSTISTSFRVHRDGFVGIHYQEGEISEEEGFALAEENLKERPRPYPFELETGKRSRDKTERQVTDKELMDIAKECMNYICEKYPRFIYSTCFKQSKRTDICTNEKGMEYSNTDCAVNVSISFKHVDSKDIMDGSFSFSLRDFDMEVFTTMADNYLANYETEVELPEEIIIDTQYYDFLGVLSSNLNGENIALKTSLLSDKVGEKVFSEDFKTDKELIITPGAPIENVARTITAEASDDAIKKGNAFAQEITDRFVSDFEKEGDKMVHVSTFIVIDDMVYMSYYANEKNPDENPEFQTARLVYAPINDIKNKTFIDLQTIGDTVDGKTIDMVYDTILMQKDDDTIYVLWTARTEENYYRFYCPFCVSQKKLGEIRVNRFKVGNITNDFSASGIRSALAENGIPCKKMFSDIGIMQKLSSRVENEETYYYSGTYSGDFTAIIKSKDLITWEYVSQPDFINDSMWENATYVLNDKVYYFVRQQFENKCGFLTAYDIKNNTWETPVEIEDCQSRGDFIIYNGELYLFHAPVNRHHIGIIKINTENIAKSEVVLQAKMQSSCFYPFVQYFKNGELAMSYTVEREHIRLAEFTLSKYL